MPTPATLNKYGLSLDEWKAKFKEQGGVCAICKNPGKLCVDHEHVPGWKKMPPEKRKTFVRGLLCWVCNYFYVGKGMTIFRSKNVTTYLEAYAARRPK